MINKEQIEEIIAEANDEIKKFGRTSQKVSKDMINALEQLKNCNIQRVSCSCNVNYGQRSMIERETGICRTCDNSFSNYS